MNSTVQALASLPYLHPYLDLIHAHAVHYDVPTPVTDALRDLISSPSPYLSITHPNLTTPS